MANLQATTFSGGLFEKTGTTTVSGTTVAVDLATGTFFVADFQTLTGDVLKIVVNNVPSAAGKATSFNLRVIQGSTARQFKWLTLGSFKWNKYYKPGTGWITHPTVPTTNNSEDVYSFTTYDNGKTWYCSVVVENCTNVKCYGERGVFCGGRIQGGNNYSDVIEYIAIGTPATTATDFGNLAGARGWCGTCSDGSRGVNSGGFTGVGGNQSLNAIQYITIATPGDAGTFGNLTMVGDEHAGMSNGIRGVFTGFRTKNATPGADPKIGRIEYITIATTGNSALFNGELSHANRWCGAAMSGNGSRGIFAGGTKDAPSPTAYYDIIDYINISTPSNAQDFGNLVLAREGCAGTSDGVRGIVMGGCQSTFAVKNEIDYITIATPANAADFGNLTAARDMGGSAVSNGSRAACGGGDTGSFTKTDAVDYVTIETPADASDWGNLTVARYYIGGCSGD